MFFRYGLRTLRRKPGFAAAIVVMLAVGIGANAAIFAVIDRLFIRPLPFNDQERIVAVENAWPLFKHSSVDGEMIPQPDDAFEAVARYEVGRVTLGSERRPEVIRLARTSGQYFSILRVGAQVGSVFSFNAGQAKENKVAVLTHGLWRRLLNEDPAVAGRKITLNGQSFTVIGVMPANFLFLARGKEVDAWIPLVPDDALVKSAQEESSGTIARLKPELTLSEAQARTDLIFERIVRSQPELKLNMQDRMLLISLADFWFGNLRMPLLMLLGAAICLLLIACANTMGLMIARSAERQKDVAIRAALGAGWIQIVRQHLVESLFLGLMGAVLGLLVAYWTIKVLLAASSTPIPNAHEISLNLRIIAFAFAISIPAAVIPGLISAWRISRSAPRALVNESSTSSASLFSPRLRKLLVASEVALTVLLLINAGLLFRSLNELLNEKLGFDPKNVLTLEITPLEAKYPDRPKRSLLYQQLIERVRNLPGVAHAGTINYLPFFSGSFIVPVSLQERSVPPERGFSWSYRVASSDYFQAMGIPVIAGRTFSEQDTVDAPAVVVLDQSAAAFLSTYFFANESVIGKHLILRFDKPTAFEIVGVVGDIRQQGLGIETYPGFYLHAPQRAPAVTNLVVRSSSDPASVFGVLRDAISEVDKDLSVSELRLMEEQVSESVARPRFALLLTSVLGGGALLLSMLGLYSLMSHIVSHRTHEIGVRMALGANVRDVVRLVLRQALGLVVAGAVLGILLSVITGRLLGSLLFGVSPMDPVTLGVVVLLLIVVALVACYVPMRRAMKIDPIEALRYE